MEWLSSNIGTIAVALILIAVIIWIVVGIVRDKKSGKHCCGGNCGRCACNCPHSVAKDGKR